MDPNISLLIDGGISYKFVGKKPEDVQRKLDAVKDVLGTPTPMSTVTIDN